jgi:hypothetical protein
MHKTHLDSKLATWCDDCEGEEEDEDEREPEPVPSFAKAHAAF